MENYTDAATPELIKIMEPAILKTRKQLMNKNEAQAKKLLRRFAPRNDTTLKTSKQRPFEHDKLHNKTNSPLGGCRVKCSIRQACLIFAYLFKFLGQFAGHDDDGIIPNFLHIF